MSPQEELPPTKSHEQEPAKKEQQEVIPLSMESREALEELRRELKIFRIVLILRKLKKLRLAHQEANKRSENRW